VAVQKAQADHALLIDQCRRSVPPDHLRTFYGSEAAMIMSAETEEPIDERRHVGPVTDRGP
jgi:hypothetical protein